MDIKQEGRVDELRGKVRSTWGDVTDDDFDRSKGDMESLIGTIKQKTGETAESIREKLQGFFDDDAKAGGRNNP
jgi:uncharacterized protein YjbJ (UPF0337 family)